MKGYTDTYKKDFYNLKEKASLNENDYEPRDFYDLIEQINGDLQYLEEQAERHPNYNYSPDKDIPASIEIEKLSLFKREIENFIRNKETINNDIELDIMFPDRHDDDFDEESMNFDSIYGSD